MSARTRIRAFLERNVGKVVTTDQVSAVANIRDYQRRIRELRDDEGMQIQSYRDRSDLKPNEYMLVSLECSPRFPHKIDKATRARILERNGLTCGMCGATAGDPDPYNASRTIRLHVDHINPDGPTVDDNLRVLCTNCNEGRANIAVPPTPKLLTVLRTVRRLPRDQQRRLLGELQKKFQSTHA